MEEDNFDDQDDVSVKIESQKSVKKGHVCTVCQKRFKKLRDLREHGSVHSSEKPFSCDHCNMKFKSKRILRNHLKYLSLIASYQCETCKKFFKFKGNLESHIRIIHMKETPFKCDMCQKSFPKKASLEYHYGSPTNLEHHRQFDEFKQFEYLVEKYKRLQSPVFHCPTCNKSYKTKYMHTHFKTHSGEKCECNICGIQLAKNYLERHMKRVHFFKEKKRYSCDVCQRSFVSKHALKMHQQTQHENIRPFKCEICSQAFGRQFQLKRHIESVHRDKEKKYPCVVCGQKYSSNNSLMYHARDHTGERPYFCEFCNRSFKGKQALNRHLKSCAAKAKKLSNKIEEEKIDERMVNEERIVKVEKHEEGIVKVEKHEEGMVKVEKHEERMVKVDSEQPTLSLKSASLSLSDSLVAAKKAFNKGSTVFESKNIKVIKVRNAAQLNISRVTNLFRMYR